MCSDPNQDIPSRHKAACFMHCPALVASPGRFSWDEGWEQLQEEMSQTLNVIIKNTSFLFQNNTHFSICCIIVVSFHNPEFLPVVWYFVGRKFTELFILLYQSPASRFSYASLSLLWTVARMSHSYWLKCSLYLKFVLKWAKCAITCMDL